MTESNNTYIKNRCLEGASNFITSNNDQLQDMCQHIIKKSSLKHVFFIYIFYILITSKTFDKNILNINEKEQNNNNTIHLLKKSFFFIIIYIFIDTLICLNIL